jgi:undecaprenyl-diphosphatase
MFRTRSFSFLAFVVGFIIFSATVASGATKAIDVPINSYAKSIEGNSNLDALMIGITVFGDVTTLVIFGFVITIVRRTRKAGMIFLITMVALAIVVMYFKPVVGRASPEYAFVPALKLPKNFDIESDSLEPFASGFSYPSGHVARATAFAFIIGFMLYRKSHVAGYAIWVFPIVIGISHIYVQQHFPTDLVGGFLIGIIICSLFSNVMKLWQPFKLSRFKGKEYMEEAG